MNAMLRNSSFGIFRSAINYLMQYSEKVMEWRPWNPRWRLKTRKLIGFGFASFLQFVKKKVIGASQLW